jgi:hypothetical protein
MLPRYLSRSRGVSSPAQPCFDLSSNDDNGELVLSAQ